MAKSPTPKPADPPALNRRQQFAQTYRMAKKSDPALGRWVLGAGVLGLVVGFGVFYLVVGRSSTRFPRNGQGHNRDPSSMSATCPHAGSRAFG